MITLDNNHITGHLYTWKPLNDDELALFVINRIIQEGPQFEFDRMGHDEPTSIEFNIRKAINLWCSNISTKENLVYGQLIIEKVKSPHTQIHMHWQSQPKGLWLNGISLGLDEEFFNSTPNVNRLLQLFSDLFIYLNCGYGKICHSNEWEEKNWLDKTLPNGNIDRISIDLRPQQGLVDLYWANFFGEPYVNLFSKEKIESCPAFRIKSISNRSYLILLSETPSDWKKPKVIQLYEQAKSHLNTHAFFNKSKPDNLPTSPTWPII